MARLSDSMEEGTVLKWLVAAGGEATRGQPLVEIETDKANMTYDSDTDGVLLAVLAQEGDTLPVGEPIAHIGERGEAPAAPAQEAEAESAPEPEAAPAPELEAESVPEPEAAPAEPQRAPDGGDGRTKASPIARRMAGELGVDLG